MGLVDCKVQDSRFYSKEQSVCGTCTLCKPFVFWPGPHWCWSQVPFTNIYLPIHPPSETNICLLNNKCDYLKSVHARAVAGPPPPVS